MEIHVVVLRRKPLAAEANWLDSRGFVKLPLRLLTGTSKIRIDHRGPSGGQHDKVANALTTKRVG